MNDIFFKIRGVNRLISFEELQRIPNEQKMKPIEVIDLKNQRSQRNYCTNYRTILRKFG